MSIPVVSEDAVVIYETGRQAVPVATISCSGGRINHVLQRNLPEHLPFGRRRLEELVQYLIELPLRIYSLRHKTMPELFDEIKCGSEEHFALLYRSHGPFKVIPKRTDL